MLHIRRILFWSLLAALLGGCNYERITKLSNDRQLPKAWFAQLEQQVFQPKCMGCHNPQNAKGGLDISSYEALMASGKITKGSCNTSPLYHSVKLGRMPLNQPRLTDAEVQAIGAWIDQGASETAEKPSVPTPTPTTTPPPALEATYRSIKKNIIDLRCLNCHSGAKPKGKLDLSTYDGLFASIGVLTPFEPLASSFLQRMLDNVDPMPPKGDRVPEAEIQIIEAWINQGALNN